MNLLDASSIREPITGMPRARLESLEVFSEIDSTNSYLLEQPSPPAGKFRVALAEQQTAGRGRMGRRWYSPPSSGLYLSMAYTFPVVPQELPCLTLAIGVGVAQCLETLDIRGIGLKWPNDIFVMDGKLGGILTEMRSSHGPAEMVVVGIGINVDLASASGSDEFFQGLAPATDLASCCQVLPSRSELSALLIEYIFDALVDFETAGFPKFIGTWNRYDWLRGKRVDIEQPDKVVTGICHGIDAHGALVLETATETTRILSGSVRLPGQ